MPIRDGFANSTTVPRCRYVTAIEVSIPYSGARYVTDIELYKYSYLETLSTQRLPDKIKPPRSGVLGGNNNGRGISDVT